MATEIRCPIWGTRALLIGSEWLDPMQIYSPRAGGNFKILKNTIDDHKIMSTDQRVSFSLWVSEKNHESKDIPFISEETYSYITSFPRLTTTQMRLKLLELFKDIRPGQDIALPQDTSKIEINERYHTDIICASIGAESFRELESILTLLHEEGILSQSVNHIRFSMKGHREIDSLSKNNNSKNVFVAMWFDDEMKDAYKMGISPAILDCGYNPIRVDSIPHNGKIDDKIISEIQKSKFIVSDFTSPLILDDPDDNKKRYEVRGGVYYEAGYAKGLGLEVIFSCRKNALNSLHFDTRQFSHILWETAEELREKLYYRIDATVGSAPGAPGLGRSRIET
jgi:hypothetical protein